MYKNISASIDPVQAGKETLLLTRNKGTFLKKCPGTRFYTCCDYEILHIGTFCNMDCSYCILQSYFHPPVLQYFVNHNDLLRSLDERFAKPGIGRIGTGEFTDSLIWEKWCQVSHLLVNKFAHQSRAVLELKTKTNAIEALRQFNHNRKTIVAWSLNTEFIIKREERHTTPLVARLKAGAKCSSWGYPLAFHFDPLIIYPGWEADYRRVVQQLFSIIAPDKIVWISLGALRFMPSLKAMIEKRFPESKIAYNEFISGLDGKMRYFKPLRIDLFRKMAAWIKEYAPDTLVYLCMEDDEVWQKSLGFVPADQGGLPHMLNQSAAKHCGVKG